MPEAPRVRVDRELIGAGNCAQLAPGAFAVDEHELVVILDPAAATDDELRTAAERCPSGAIYLDEQRQVAHGMNAPIWSMRPSSLR
jgi:ferredoxin